MTRIDIELVNRCLFNTRSQAQFAIKSGIVLCNNKNVNKSSLDVTDEDTITIVGERLKYVSKGGLKLEKAINVFKIKLDGKKMIDIGSSTGGFSHCAILNNVESILAIDVGKLQFADILRNNNRITLMENTDFRNVDDELLSDYSVATIDVSFISITKLLPKLAKINSLNEIVLLVKPQFEVGIDLAKKYNGVINNIEAHKKVLKRVIIDFKKIDFNIIGLTFSPIRGGSGNIEYLAYFKKNDKISDIDVDNIVENAFSNFDIRLLYENN